MAALKYRDENGVYHDIVGINVQCEPDNEDLHYNSSNQLQFKDRPNTDGMGRIILRKNIVSGVNTLTQSMMTQTNTIYVIQYDFTLGEDITIPANCVLEFDGGSINDGNLNLNGSIIESAKTKIFNSVVLSNVGNKEFNAEWVLGNNENVNTTDFEYLPKIPINFNNKTYRINGSLNISMYAVWSNLNLYVRSLSILGEVLESVGCSKNSHLPFITLSSTPEHDIAGKLALIKTANHVAYDWRDDESGVPTLYKGMTSICGSYNSSNQRCYIYDNMENFAATVSYNDKTLVSSVSFANPATVEMYNCNITLTKLSDQSFAGGVAIVYAKDVKLVNCNIQPDNSIGSECLVSIRQCVGGIIDRCFVKGAWFNNSQTSYGIQCNSSTRISITNSQFEYNRRSVDFSGGYETRYCSVENCIVSNGTDVGSGFGGHSTSYGNSYRNNTITGTFTYGIWCRGENEIVEGNNILSVHSSAAIAVAYKTRVANNSNKFDRATSQGIGIALYNIPNVTNNEIFIEGNSFLVYNALFDMPYDDSYNGKITLVNNDITFVSKATSYSVTERIFNKHVDNIELIGNAYNFSSDQYNSLFAESAAVTNGKFIETIPIKIVRWSADLPDYEKAKLSNVKCYLICNWSSEVHRMKLLIDFTLSAGFTDPIGLKPSNFASIDVSAKYKQIRWATAGLLDDAAQNITIWPTAGIIYLGKGDSYNGIFNSAGRYRCIIEWE